MKKSVAIARARVLSPSQPLLLRALMPAAAATALILAGSVEVQAEPKAKTAGGEPFREAAKLTDRATVGRAAMAASDPSDARAASSLHLVATSSSVRGANDLATTADLTTSVVNGTSLMKPSSATPRKSKSWYPEAHNYLRPYHYRWRYWTPG